MLKTNGFHDKTASYDGVDNLKKGSLRLTHSCDVLVMADGIWVI